VLDSVRGVARPNPGRVDFAQQHQLRIASHVPALHHSRTGVRRRGHRSLREKLQLGQTLAEHLPTDPKSADSRQQPTTANSQQQPTADNSQQPTTANSQQPTTADNSQQQPTTANSRQPTTADSRQQPTAHRQGHKPGNQQKRRKKQKSGQARRTWRYSNQAHQQVQTPPTAAALSPATSTPYSLGTAISASFFFAKERVPTAEKPAKTRSDAGIPEGSERRFLF
jgi:outer membrane biosynthesis protein TonB